MAKKVKTLTTAQLKVIDGHSSWMEIKNLELKCLKLELLNARYKAQIEISELDRKSSMLDKSIHDKIKAHKGKMKIIADKFKIKGQWSFDPDTGEVKEG